VLSEHGIKIAPSISYPGAKTAITLAELAEAYLVQTRWWTGIRPSGRVEVLLDPFEGARVQIRSAARLLPRMIKSLSS
jgi:hypothetical protein